MIKKVLAMTIAAVSVLALTACSNSSSTPSPSEAAQEASAAVTDASPAPESSAPVESAPEQSAPAEQPAAPESFSIVGTWYDIDDAGDSIVFTADGKFTMYEFERNAQQEKGSGTYTVNNSVITAEGTEIDDGQNKPFSTTISVDGDNVISGAFEADNHPDVDTFMRLGDVTTDVDTAILTASAWKGEAADGSAIECTFSSDGKLSMTVAGESTDYTFKIDDGFVEAEQLINDDIEILFALSKDGKTLYPLMPSLGDVALAQ